MKKNNLVFSILLFAFSITAQEKSSKGLVVYNQIFQMDTVRRTFDVDTESFLFFDVGTQQSVYVWNRRSNFKTKEIVKLNDGTGYFKIKNCGSDPIGQIVFKDYKNNNLVERKLGQVIKIVADSFKINWQITSETKNIKDMVLQKAECDFRGRHYIAWFNPKIPIPDGPWKLRGLPGLIIEAYDEKKHIQFNFTSLSLSAEYSEKIEAPTNGENVVYDCAKFTAAHYERVRELRKQMAAKAAQAGGTTQMAEIGGTTNTIERCY